MCVAITMEPNTELTLEEVTRMGRTNGDGIGIAYAEDGVVNWTKAVNYMPHQAYNYINSYKGYFRLVHFRLSTAGGVMSQLCHPFEVGPLASCAANGHGSKALIHNGHWHRWSDIFDILKKEDALPDRGPWSDSRLMAYLAHHDPAWLDVVTGKVAVMDGDGNTTRWGDWLELRPGIKVSNKSWDHGYNYTRRGKDRDWPGWGWTEEQWREKEAHEAEIAKKALESEKAKSNGQTEKETAGGSDGAQGTVQSGTSGANVSLVSQSGGTGHVLQGGSSTRNAGGNDRDGNGPRDGNGVHGRPRPIPAGNCINHYGYDHTVPGEGKITFSHTPWQNKATGDWWWIPPTSVQGRKCRIERITEERARSLMGAPAAGADVDRIKK